MKVKESMKNEVLTKRLCAACLSFVIYHLSFSAVQAQTVVTMGSAVTDGTYYYQLFSSSEALDFTQTEGLEAYVCTRKRLQYGSEPQVTLTRIERAPAGTGLLLRSAEARSYALHSAEGDVAAPRRNYLVAVGERTDEADLFSVDSDGMPERAVALLAAGNGTAGFAESPLASDYKKVDGTWQNVYHRGERFLEAGTAYLPILSGEGDWLAHGDTARIILLSEPEALPTVATVGEAKQLAEQATTSDELLLTLSAARVSFARPTTADDADLCIIEDATGGLLLRQSGLGDRLLAGDTLTGELPLTIRVSMLGSELLADEATLAALPALTISHGDVKPFVVTGDNIDDYAESYDWRLARFSGVRFVGGEEPQLFIDLLDDHITLFDLLQQQPQAPADGTTLDAVGYLFSYLGGIYFQPIDFIVDGASTAVEGLTDLPIYRFTDLPIYDLSGRLVGNQSVNSKSVNSKSVNSKSVNSKSVNGKSIRIIGGRKWLLK